MKKKIVFIGAGKVAWHLSCALSKKGYAISGIASRKKLSAKKLADKFNTAWSDKPEEIVKDADIIFITTPDAEVRGVVQNLCSRRVIKRKQLVIHTSGVLGVREIKCVEKFGALALSMHPGFPFSSKSYKKDELRGVFFVLEGSKKAVRIGKEIVHKLGARSLMIEEKSKAIYHLALIFASNFFVGVEDMSVELLQKCGIKRNDALELLKPLIEVTKSNIFKQGTRNALTGPIERGDVETVKKHLALLKRYQNSFEKIYKEISRYLLVMVEEKGKIKQEKIKTIRDLLNDAGGRD